MPTFADADRIEEHGEQEGLKDAYVDRKLKGIHDAVAMLIELDVEEDDDGQLHKVPRLRYWGGEYLERIGRQVNGESFIRDFTAKNPQHFEVSGDRHQSAPEDMDNPSGHSLNELVEKEAKWQDERRPDDRTILELGDLIEGVTIFRGQGTEVSSYTERERQYITSLIEGNLEDLVESGLEDDQFNDPLREFYERDIHQMLSQDIGHQFKRVDEKIGAYYDHALENGAELYAFSGDHGNRSAPERHMEESTILELMLDRSHRGYQDPADIDDVDDLFDPVENRQETQVNTFGGNKDAIAYVSFDDCNWEALLGHTPQGRGRSPIQKTINQPADNDVRLVGFANYHDGAAAHQDGTLYLNPPANAPTNGLTLKIGDGTRPRGIISDVVLDEDGEKDYGEIEFFLPEA
jgi:hypothetical protein